MTTATATAAPFTLPAAGLGRPFAAKYAGKCALTGRDVYQGSQMRSTPYGFALVESVALVSSTGYTAPDWRNVWAYDLDKMLAALADGRRVVVIGNGAARTVQRKFGQTLLNGKALAGDKVLAVRCRASALMVIECVYRDGVMA